MPDENMSLADAIAPTPAPTPAPAPTDQPAVTANPAPQPIGAGIVNPYVPPAEPPQNLQNGAPPVPDQGQPAPQGDQPPQPQQPQIPPEYLEAHDWRGKIGEEAKAFGGLDMVPEALKWSRMLFGLEPAPDGMTPAGHFMQQLFSADRQVYQDLLGEIVATHADRLIPILEERVLAGHEIPKARLAEVKDFLRYGRVAVADTAHREFVGQLKPEIAAIFPKLTQAQQNFYVDQVDRGLMTWEFVEQEIREKGILLAMQERDEQFKQRDDERTKTEAKQRTQAVIDDHIGRYENAFVEAKAREMGVDAELVRDMVARVAGELDREGARDPQSAIAKAWRNLEEAAASGSEMRLRPAVSAVQLIVEQRFDAMLAKRGKAPTNGHQPPNGQPQQQATSLRQPQQQQFDPDKPANPDDLSNVSLYDHLFGRAGG